MSNDSEWAAYRGSYDLSSPAGHFGIGKVVFIDATLSPPPPGFPTRYWAYERPPRKGASGRSFFGQYPTSLEACVGLLEWAKSQGLTAVKIKKSVYIAEDGDDKNDGLTPETAVRSFARAHALIEKGDEVHFKDQESFDRMTAETAELKRTGEFQENLLDSGLPPWVVRLGEPQSNQ